MSILSFKVKGMTLALHMNILVTKNKVGFCLLEGWKMVIPGSSFPTSATRFPSGMQRFNSSQHLLLMPNQSCNTLHYTLTEILQQINVLGFSVSLSVRSAETGKMG